MKIKEFPALDGVHQPFDGSKLHFSYFKQGKYWLSFGSKFLDSYDHISIEHLIEDIKYGKDSDFILLNLDGILIEHYCIFGLDDYDFMLPDGVE